MPFCWFCHKAAHFRSFIFQSMLALMNILGWKRVLVTYAGPDYQADADEFVRQAHSKGVCVVWNVPLPSMGTVANYYDIISAQDPMRGGSRDISRDDVNGAAFFGAHGDMKTLMAALQLNTTTAHIQWLLSAVNMNDDVVSNRMRGTVFVQPQFTEVTEFFDYFTNNIDENNPPPENPWYQDWFMTTFQ